MGNSSNSIVGVFLLTYNGVDLGFTTPDGYTLNEDFETVVLKASQKYTESELHRFNVAGMLSASFLELDQAKMKIFTDLSNDPSSGTLDGTYKAKLTKAPLVLTGPGPDGGTRVITFSNASVMTKGEQIFKNNEYTNVPVEFKLLASDDEEKYYDIVDTAGSTATPAVQSYDTVDSGGTETALADDDTGVPIDDSFQFEFNVSIRPDQLTTSKFYLIEQGGSTSVAATVAYGATSGSTDYKKVKVTPTSNLTNSTTYDLVAVGGIASFDNLKTVLAQISFTTTA